MTKTATTTSIRILATAILGVLIGFACSSRVDGRDPEYQKRIDAHCRHHCDKEAECTPGDQSPFSSVSDCFDECSQGDYWWEGDDACRDARWAFNDCLDTITACEVWNQPATPPSPCESLYAPYGGACSKFADGG